MSLSSLISNLPKPLLNLLPNHTPALDLRFLQDGRSVRFTSQLDAETQAFEDELSATPLEGGAALELPLPQRHLWLQQVHREFRVMQIRDRDGRPTAQAVVYIARSQRLPAFGHAVAHKLGVARSGEEELHALRLLREACTRCGDLLTLRLQPRRLDPRALRDFEDRARLCGFTLCEPDGVTRTVIFDLLDSQEAALAAIGSQLRRKIRSRDKNPEIEIRVLTEPRFAAECQAASQASVERTGGMGRRLDWEALFGVARQHPTLLRVLGIFLPGRPELLAFASAGRHGRDAEYLSAGSVDDPDLRKVPFNYWLLWELFNWAREHGSRHMDLGGVTVGGDGDPLAGISRFKRHITDNEVEVGRELRVTLRPLPSWLVETARLLRATLPVK